MLLKPNTTRLISILAATVFIVLVAVNWRLIKVSYYVLKNDHFNKGDKVYLSEKVYIHRSTGDVINFYGKLKPVNSSMREQIALVPLGISIDSLQKYKTRFIGIYAKSEVLFGNTDEGYIPGGFCAFKVDKRFTQIDSASATKIPSGYEIDDEYYYLPYSFVATR